MTLQDTHKKLRKRRLQNILLNFLCILIAGSGLQLTPGAPACPTCTDGCFACGECIEVCPTHAIHFSEDQSSIETDIHKCINAVPA